MDTNNLETILQTGVKFYASKSKAEALALATQQENPEPGAICFVSDNSGNYIILNGRIFGDGTSGTGGGGAVSSVNSKTGAVVLELNDFPVVEVNGLTLKTLLDYFTNDGTVISDSFKVQDSNSNDVVVINDLGIRINGSKVITLADLTNLGLNDIQTLIQTAEQNAKNYADSLISSVYKVKGSVNYVSSLPNNNNEIGDVYNVTSSGMNYVWTGSEWDPLGGTINLDNIYTKSEVNLLITEEETYRLAADLLLLDKIDNNTTRITNLSNSVDSLSSTTNSHTTQINQNTTNITNIATTLTWQ